jgi:GntR family transcriptional regulator
MSLDGIHQAVKKSALPRYSQLKEIIRSKIRCREWQPGDLLPSERAFCIQYGMSRMTVRQALTELVNEGMLHREHGKGTFVNQFSDPRLLTRLTGFTEQVEAQGQQSLTKVLSAQMKPADKVTARQLRIKTGRLIFCLQRLRLVNETPIALESGLISFIGCEQLLEEDLEHNSLFQLLETKYGLPPLKAEQELDIGIVGIKEAGYLNMPIGSPIHMVQVTVYTERDQPILYGTSIYRNTSIKVMRDTSIVYPVYSFH